MADGLAKLLTVHSGFHARIVAARLGADGIPVQLTGASDGPYPVGATTLWVLAGDLDEATGLLLLDEAEWVLAEADADEQVDTWADDLESATPLARLRYFGVPVPMLLAAPLVGMAVTSLVLRV
jgi:hypothetical protein